MHTYHNVLPLVGLLIAPLCSAEIIEEPFVPKENDLQAQRVQFWETELRSADIRTPQQMPDFLKPIKEMYRKDAEAFIAEHPDYSGEFRCDAEELIDRHFCLLARYYYLQLYYGEYCYGIKNQKALAGNQKKSWALYKQAVQQDVTRLALQMLKECVWSASCVWTADHETIDQHPARVMLKSLPPAQDFGPVRLMDDRLQHMLDTQAETTADMHTYGSLMDSLRSSRIYDIADVLVQLHLYSYDNTLNNSRWSSEKEARYAAVLLIAQFDAWRALMHNALDNSLYIPPGLSVFIGTSYSATVDFFYSNQEAFLRRAYNFEQAER